MAGEVVRIRLGRERATFHATFEMVNDGYQATTLDVGFPAAVRYSSWSTDVKTRP